MGNKLSGIHRGFSLVELAVAIVIMGIMASVMVISPGVSKQSAKHEAERLQEYIYRQIQKSDRIHKNFELEVGTTYVYINWGNNDTKDKSYAATSGCRYESGFGIGEGKYNPNLKRFPSGGHVEIVDTDGEKYYVIIEAVGGGRIRISSDLNPPK